VKPTLAKPEIAIITDYASKDATAFARKTVATYTSASENKMTVREDACHYACTDNSACMTLSIV
jgi:hypothetical protein